MLDVKSKIQSISSFLFKKHKTITAVVITVIACGTVGAVAASTIANESSIVQQKQLNAKYKTSSMLSVVESVSSNSSSDSSSQVTNQSPSSIPESATAPASSQAQASFVHGQKQAEWFAQHPVSQQTQTQQQSQVQTPAQNTQAASSSKTDINTTPYAITVRYNITTYKSNVANDTNKVNQAQQNLTDIQNQKDTWEINATGSWGYIANPTKVHNAQIALQDAQNQLASDQRELQYYEDIANSQGITY